MVLNKKSTYVMKSENSVGYSASSRRKVQFRNRGNLTSDYMKTRRDSKNQVAWLRPLFVRPRHYHTGLCRCGAFDPSFYNQMDRL